MRCYGGRWRDSHTRVWEDFATATLTKPSANSAMIIHSLTTSISSTVILSPSVQFLTSTAPGNCTWWMRCVCLRSVMIWSTGGWTSCTWSHVASISTTNGRNMSTRKCARRRSPCARGRKRNSGMGSARSTRSGYGTYSRSLLRPSPQG